MAAVKAVWGIFPIFQTKYKQVKYKELHRMQAVEIVEIPSMERNVNSGFFGSKLETVNRRSEQNIAATSVKNNYYVDRDFYNLSKH